jgi:hypothetical protein
VIGDLDELAVLELVPVIDWRVGHPQQTGRMLLDLYVVVFGSVIELLVAYIAVDVGVGGLVPVHDRLGHLTKLSRYIEATWIKLLSGTRVPIELSIFVIKIGAVNWARWWARRHFDTIIL